MFTPSASRTSALPHWLETERLPCLAIRMPQAASTIAAAVEILNVPERSPPVPQVSNTGPGGGAIATAFARIVWIAWARTATHGQRKEIWRRFGVWLLLGLEFELAADIIGSVISPSWKDIGELGAIAAIRTILNYFLEKDLERAEMAGNEERRTSSP